MVKTFGSYNMTLLLYPDPCYNEVCYKGTAPYCFVVPFLHVIITQSSQSK